MNDLANKWHQQPAIWVVLGVLGFTFFSSFALLFLAANNQPEMVVDDYTAIAEISAQESAREARAQELGLTAVIEFAINTAGDGSATEATVRLTAQSDYATPATLQLRIKHSTRAALDRTALLEQRGNAYVGSVAVPPSPFTLIIGDIERSWRLSARLPGPVSRLELESVPLSQTQP